jgi:hypothetical protein
MKKYGVHPLEQLEDGCYVEYPRQHSHGGLPTLTDLHDNLVRRGELK